MTTPVRDPAHQHDVWECFDLKKAHSRTDSNACWYAQIWLRRLGCTTAERLLMLSSASQL
jgi:hypothetical protein